MKSNSFSSQIIKRAPSLTSVSFRRSFLLVLLVAGGFLGCQRAYFNALEKAGYHKRDILVSRVEKVQKAQTEAKEEFASALEKFTSVVNFKGGELESKYNTLNKSFERSESRAEAVKDRIDSVESVAKALFKEWEKEIDTYQSAQLRRESSRKFDATEDKYEDLLKAMRKAEARIDPVLSAFRDQVMFLKHNLNARAISSLKGELVVVEQDVSNLIREMEASINEADKFIQSMNAG